MGSRKAGRHAIERRTALEGRLADGRSDQMRQRGGRMAQSHWSDAGRVCDASSGGRDTHQRGRGMAGTGAGTGTRLAAVGVWVFRLFVMAWRRRRVVRVTHGPCRGTGHRMIRLPVRCQKHLGGGERRAGPVEHQAQGDQDTEQDTRRAHGRNYTFAASTPGHLPDQAKRASAQRVRGKWLPDGMAGMPLTEWNRVLPAAPPIGYRALRARHTAQ